MRKQKDNKCNDCGNWFIAVYDKLGRLPVKCKSCEKYERQLNGISYKYEVDITEAKRLLDLRNEKRCECCNDKYRNIFSTYHIDHDHDTGEVRGVVCPRCNTAFGSIENNLPNDAIEDYHYKWLGYKVSRYPYQPDSFSSVLFVK